MMLFIKNKIKEIKEMFFNNLRKATKEAYDFDLKCFMHFLNAKDLEQTIKIFLFKGKDKAENVIWLYKKGLMKIGLSPNTINRRLAALQSLARVAHQLGYVKFYLTIKKVKQEPFYDMTGPSQKEVCLIMEALAKRKDAKGRRDYAIVSLLYDLALRRGEAVALDLADVDLKDGKLWILGKGKTLKEQLSIPTETHKALKAWIKKRGDQPGPLFTNFDRAGKGGRLTGHSVARIVGAFSDLVGRRVRPHGFRHSAITSAIDMTKGNIGAVQSLARISDIKHIKRLDDKFKNRGDKIADLIAAKARLN